MDGVARQFIDRIATLQSELGEMPEDFQNEFYKWALETVSLVAFQRRLGCLDPGLAPDSPQVRLIDSVNALFEVITKIETGLPLWKLYRTRDYRLMEEHHEVFRQLADAHITANEAALLARVAAGTLKPEAMKELSADPQQPIPAQHLAKFSYLKHVIREARRIF